MSRCAPESARRSEAEVDGGSTVICARHEDADDAARAAQFAARILAKEGLDRRSKCHRRFRPQWNKDQL